MLANVFTITLIVMNVMMLQAGKIKLMLIFFYVYIIAWIVYCCGDNCNLELVLNFKPQDKLTSKMYCVVQRCSFNFSKLKSDYLTKRFRKKFSKKISHLFYVSITDTHQCDNPFHIYPCGKKRWEAIRRQLKRVKFYRFVLLNVICWKKIWVEKGEHR